MRTVNRLRLGFIGAGNMATAILDGVLAEGLFPPERIIVSNPHTDKLEHPKSLGAQVTCDNRDVAAAADLIVLAVKPQKFEEVLAGIEDCCAGKCIVSIAAGISTDWIRSRLPGAVVVRAMPNTPLQLGQGATVVAQAPKISPHIEKIKESLEKNMVVSHGRVNVKATTEEKMGFTGSLEGIAAHAVCILTE